MNSIAATRPSRATVLALLLVATLSLAGLLGYEAILATRSRRVTAERTVHDYATIAAWELASRTEAELTRQLERSLEPVTGGLASSPYDRLPPVTPLSQVIASTAACAPVVQSFGFRLDLRDQSLVTDRTGVPGQVVAQLRDAVLADARQPGTAGARYHVVWGRGQDADAIIGYGLRAAQSGASAIPGASIAAYGVRTCAGALAVPMLMRTMAGPPLLPSPLLSGLPNDSLLSLALTSSAGDTLYRSSSFEPSPFEAATTLGGAAGPALRIALRRGAIERLAVSPPQPVRLPILIGLLVLSGSLAVVGVLQLRREHELARLRADFTSSVSHELRTPLAQILLFGETLALGRTRSEQERRQAAGTIVREARRLMHMVENVLHLARLERGVPAVRPAPVVLAPELRRIVADFRQLPAGAGSNIDTVLDEELTANVDADALRQIVLNLLENAAKYGAGSAVTLGLERHGDEALVWVEDHGTGIGSDDLERIWHPFTRGTTGQSSQQGGSGIGLAVVRALAEAHGGSAEASNRDPGCRFTVTLPMGGAERSPG
jgi:signal transduction histidine kinase